MKKEWLLRLWLSLSVIFSSGACSTAHKEEQKIIDEGPVVTSCVLDFASKGYQCAKYNQDPYFVGFNQVGAGGMVCISPMELENTLKACKKGEMVQVTECQVIMQSGSCMGVDQKSLDKDLKSMDNYFCLSPLDLSRLKQRCNPRGY